MAQKETKTKSKSRGMTATKIAAIGAGVASIGAGAYYLLGPYGKKHQKKLKVWMTKMEKEVSKNVSKLKTVSRPVYNKAVDALVANYSKQYKEYAPEIKVFAKQLKGNWELVKRKAGPVVKKSIRVKKLAKRVIKKKTK